MSNSSRLPGPGRKAAVYLTLFGFTMATACGDEALLRLATEGQALSSTYGAAVSAHPRHRLVSDNLDRGISAALAQATRMSPAALDATLARLESCSASGNPAPCATLVESFGFRKSLTDRIRADARGVVVDVGIPASAIITAFTEAQVLTDGPGDQSRLIRLVEDEGLPCTGDCAEFAGNGLGSAKGTSAGALAFFVSGPPEGGGEGGGGEGGSSSDSGSSGDDDGLSTSEIISIIKIVIDVIKIVIDLLPEPEEDPNCITDAHCPADQFCHRAGINDCRARRANGALCTRGGQCASGRCVPHISNLFLPTCRP